MSFLLLVGLFELFGQDSRLNESLSTYQVEEPNVLTYTSLISAAAKQGRLEAKHTVPVAPKGPVNTPSKVCFMV